MTSKRILLVTLGTRGDVQPYVYLARALKRAGFVPIVATHPCWATLVTEAGVDFASIGPDVDIAHEAAMIRTHSAHWLLGAIKTMKFVFTVIEGASDEIYGLCRDADLVIASHSHAGAVEAQACNKPMVSVTLQPEALPQPNEPSAGWRRLAKSVAAALVNPVMVRPFNKLRTKYDLKPVKSIDGIMSPCLNLIPVSTYLVEPNPYWDRKDQIVGCWYEHDEPCEPDPRLESFLRSGEKPIIVALGAMAFESGAEKEKLSVLLAAFQAAGMRAIIQGFDETLKTIELPESVLCVGAIPHSWLFKQGCCVIHHGGFGTTAAAILAGRPSIVIPHVLDQFMWANRVFELNVAAKPIKVGELTVEALVGAIESVKFEHGQMVRAAEELSAKMRQEDGLGIAVNLVRHVYDRGCRLSEAEQPPS